MSDPLATILSPLDLEATLFPVNSRYHGIAINQMSTSDGRIVVYLRRRFVPSPERFALLHEHTVTAADRVDNLAAQYLGDPEQLWRLCDANGVIRPAELVETAGQRVRITLPEGVPGSTDD
jgi:hypothetical protein